MKIMKKTKNVKDYKIVTPGMYECIRLVVEKSASDKEYKGEMTYEEAAKIAESNGLDLVLINDSDQSPLVKAIELSRLHYEDAKKAKKALKAARDSKSKEIRLSTSIEDGDLKIKADATKKFLQKGRKVRIFLRLKGREIARPENGRKVLNDFAALLGDSVRIESPAKQDGRIMAMTVIPA